MLLCIWFPSESGFLTLDSLSLGVAPSSDVSIWKHNDVAGIHCQIGARGDVNCLA